MLFSPWWCLALEGGTAGEKQELKERWFSSGETEKLLLCRVSPRKDRLVFLWILPGIWLLGLGIFFILINGKTPLQF